jgi:hypothetical protein
MRQIVHSHSCSDGDRRHLDDVHRPLASLVLRPNPDDLYRTYGP